MRQLLLASLLFLQLATPAAANLLVNGSFGEGINPPEGMMYRVMKVGSTDITGWVVGGNSIDWINTLWSASDGRFSIDLNAYDRGTLSQSFKTIPDSSYLVTFDLAANADKGTPFINIKTLTVTAGGEPIDFSFDATNTSFDAMGWTPHQYVFKATGDSTTLTFTSTTDTARGPAIDNVAVSMVTPAGPPQLVKWSAEGTVADVLSYPPGPAGLDCFARLGMPVSVTVMAANTNLGSGSNSAGYFEGQFFEATIDPTYMPMSLVASNGASLNASYVTSDRFRLTGETNASEVPFAQGSVAAGRLVSEWSDKAGCKYTVVGQETSRTRLLVGDANDDRLFDSSDLGGGRWTPCAGRANGLNKV
jgi:choice-of-anchor C domain-containing protein